jgi:hypothetical protein
VIIERDNNNNNNNNNTVMQYSVFEHKTMITMGKHTHIERNIVGELSVCVCECECKSLCKSI